MDFGIARAVKGKSITGSGVMIGTPQYMSPEQVEGKDIDQRSDIYSLGIILYEMLTDRVPFEGDTPLTVGVKQKTEKPRDPKEFNERIPDGLSQLILRCLEKEKENRFQSADELKTDLEKLEQGLPTTERVEPKTKPLTSREITVKFSLKKILIPALFIVVLIAAGLVLLMSRGPAFDPNRVVVVEFLNQTGDSRLDRIGRQVAETVSQGVESMGLFEVLPPARLDLKPNYSLEEKYFRQMARNYNSAIVVTGEYYPQGRSLIFYSKIYDSLEQKLLPSPSAIMGQTEDLSEAFEKLRNRLMSSILRTHDPRVEMWLKISSYTPQYEALLEFISGIELFWRGQNLQSIEYFDQAVEIDPEYLLPAVFAIAAHMNTGNLTIMDQYLEKIGQFANLSPGERYIYDYFKAYKESDNETKFLIWQKLEALAPGTALSYQLASEALATNRPYTAVEALERLDPESIHVNGDVGYWGRLTLSHHMIGNYEQELKESLKAHQQYPQSWEPLWYKIRALSALGRVTEIKKVLEESYGKPLTIDRSPAMLMYEAGEELKTHGYDDEAVEMFEQALSWLSQRSQKEGLSEYMKLQLAWAQFDTQHLVEAESTFRDLNESNPENLVYIGALGIVASRKGDRQKALKISERLKNWDKPYSFGEHTYWQAAIFANLGEKDRAVSLLQTSIQQGYFYANLYCRSTLEPLWDYPAFIEFMKPRD
jgi:tetratricopeptide (TPR) repeat protein